MNHELFINFEHQKRFMEIRQQLNADLQMDHNWLPMIFLMAGNKEVENVLLPHMDLPKGKFDYNEIKEPGVLINLAIEFYNEENSLFVNDLTNLNRREFDLALAAIRIKHKISWYSKN